MSNFMYPDFEDKLTVKYINANELYKGYWEKSEKRVLNYFIKKYLRNTRGRMLDIGCGLGRLSLFFSKYFDEIIALEPDQSRYEKAKENLEKLNSSIIVKTILGNLDCINADEYFDFILCSHVIQHIPYTRVQEILSECSNRLNNNGYFVLMTSHSLKAKDYFVKVDQKNNELFESEISETQFNDLTLGKDVLPTRMFTINSLRELFNNSNLDLIDYRVFHLENISPLERIFINDFSVNLFNKYMDRYGRDILVIGKRRV